MPLFICDKCGVLENTALGCYWARKYILYSDESFKRKALCSECAPTSHNDGSPTEYGAWHGKFERIFPDKEKIEEIGIENFVSSDLFNEIMQPENGKVKANMNLKSNLAIAAMMGLASGLAGDQPPVNRNYLPKRRILSTDDRLRIDRIRDESNAKQKAKEARRAARMQK